MCSSSHQQLPACGTGPGSTINRFTFVLHKDEKNLNMFSLIGDLCFSLAKLTAAVMLSRDVTVHLFSTFVPTPYVVRKCCRITSCSVGWSSGSH